MRLNKSAGQTPDHSQPGWSLPAGELSRSLADLSSHRLNIDTLRGLACLLLVSFHVVGVPDTGLRLPDQHWLVQINEVLIYLRMPLFSFISGYVYAARPFEHHAAAFLQKKARRLLLPMLTVGTLYAVIQRLTPGTNAIGVDQWWLLHIVPVGHFWFLEALFLIFLLVVALESAKLLSGPTSFALVFAASAVLFAVARLPVYFGASGVVYLLPFFLAGLACRRFAIDSQPLRWLAAALLLSAAGWLITQESSRQVSALAGLIVSTSCVYLLLRSRWQVRWLAYVGHFSFAIYLMHVFFTAASRLALTAVGLNDAYLHTLLGTAAGVLGPIAAAQLISRSPALAFWLLGQRRGQAGAD